MTNNKSVTNQEVVNTTVTSSSLQASNGNSSGISSSDAFSLQQQQIDASPIATQLNKIMKKPKKDTEKKMLLDDEF